VSLSETDLSPECSSTDPRTRRKKQAHRGSGKRSSRGTQRRASGRLSPRFSTGSKPPTWPRQELLSVGRGLLPTQRTNSPDESEKHRSIEDSRRLKRPHFRPFLASKCLILGHFSANSPIFTRIRRNANSMIALLPQSSFERHLQYRH